MIVIAVLFSMVFLPCMRCIHLEDYFNTSLVYKSYQKSIHCYPAEGIKYPRNIRDLLKFFSKAKSSGQTVKPVGALGSATDVICTEGVPISLLYINYAILNKDGTATFGAGIKLYAALSYLERKNKTLAIIPTYGDITIGGALGTGAHASSLIHPAIFSDLVVSLRIIDGRGLLKIIDDIEELKAFRVHLGLLGILVDVTLKTTALSNLIVHNTVHSEEFLLNGTCLEWGLKHDAYQLWWFPSLKEVVVSRRSLSNSSIQPAANYHTNYIAAAGHTTVDFTARIIELLQSTKNTAGLEIFETFTKMTLLGGVTGRSHIYKTPDAEENFNFPVAGISWKMQTNKCGDKCYWNNEIENPLLIEETAMAFDLKDFKKVMSMMKTILNKEPAAFPVSGILIRFIPPSDGLLALSNGRPTFVVEWAAAMRKDKYNDAMLGLGTYQRIAQEMVRNYGGRPHWGKNGLHFFTEDVLQTLPKRQDFVKAMKRYDPNGLFLNKFGRRMLGLSNEIDIDPKAHRCALQNYCICKRNRDCGVSQICVVEGDFNVCKDLKKTSGLPEGLHTLIEMLTSFIGLVAVSALCNF